MRQYEKRRYGLPQRTVGNSNKKLRASAPLRPLRLSLNFLLKAAEQVLLTLWIGSMWAIGYLAVPVLFRVLDDRMLAGMLAGKMFTLLNFLGLFCGVLLFVGLLLQQGRTVLSGWRSWMLVSMLLLICVVEFILQPQMAELKQLGLEGEHLQQFRWLHGISSILFLLNSLAGLVLIVRGVQK